MKFTEKLGVNSDKIRIRSFEFNGELLRVRVPLMAEADLLYEKIKSPNPELIEAKYQELSKPLLDQKDAFVKENSDIEYKDNDIVLAGTSIRELATSQVGGETRILETLKMLVPKDGSYMDDLTYEDINVDMALQTQLDLVKKISEVISPNYEETRKN